MLIFPPPDLRKVILKTAQFVIKNGKEFEEKIRIKWKGSFKFSFLNQNDPYYPFYIKSLDDSEFCEQLLNEENFEITEEANRIKEPPIELEYLFLAKDISPHDLDMIKLTAQFFSLHGNVFLISLFNLESNSYLFDFLKPLNPKNMILRVYSTQYTKILSSETKADWLSNNVRSKFDILNTISLLNIARVHQKKLNLINKKKESIKGKQISKINWIDFLLIDHINHAIFEDEFCYDHHTMAPINFTELMMQSILEKRKTVWDIKN